MSKEAVQGSGMLTALVDGAKANLFDWGSIQWLVNSERMAGSNLTFGFVQIEGGHKNPRHYHPNCDEVLFLIEGELAHSVDETVYHLTPGMAIFIPQDAVHDAVNPGAATARMVVAYSTGDRQTVMLEAGKDD